MPTERFYNLPEEKRTRIIHAVYEEMCRVPFDELSINKIVQRAEIPRGSFYQYFKDKEELLSYMMEDFRDMVFKVAKDTLVEVQGDIFETFFQILKKMVEIGEQEHRCQVLKNVSFGMKVNHVQNVRIFQKKGEDFTFEMYQLTDKSKFNIESIEDFREVVSLLGMLMWSAGVEIFLDLSKKDEILKRAEKRIQMIKNGVLIKGGEKQNV